MVVPKSNDAKGGRTGKFFNESPAELCTRRGPLVPARCVRKCCGCPTGPASFRRVIVRGDGRGPHARSWGRRDRFPGGRGVQELGPPSWVGAQKQLSCHPERVYRPPDVPGIELRRPPVLESWNARDHPDQLRLHAFLDEVEAAVAICDEAANLALELQVGLPQSKSLTSGGGDLDNYLFPIARRIGAGRLDAAFGTKRHATTSTLAVGRWPLARHGASPRAGRQTWSSEPRLEPARQPGKSRS